MILIAEFKFINVKKIRENMKKLILKGTTLVLFGLSVLATSAIAEKRAGITAMIGEFSVSGKETLKDTGIITKKDAKAFFVAPSIFFETDLGPIVLGIDYIPTDLEFENNGVLSGHNDAANSGSGQTNHTASFTANDNGTQKVGVELQNHLTAYIQIPLPDTGLYAKIGMHRVDVKTTESLVTGSTYGDEEIYGTMLGFGFMGDVPSIDTPVGDPGGMFFKVEVTYSKYDNINMDSSKDADGLFNKIVADNIEGTAARISVGKSF